MLYIEYVSSVTTESERMIKYRFTNALWYKVDEQKTVATRFPVSHSDDSEIEITVQGLFRKSIYTVQLKHDHVQVLRVA
jgi:hypothetical protein